MMAAWLFNPLVLFLIAASSLLFSGFLLAPGGDLEAVLFLQWCSVCGIFLIYRGESFFGQIRSLLLMRGGIRVNIIPALFLLQLAFIMVFSLKYLSAFTVSVLALVGTGGVLYSLVFSFRGRGFRVKDVFLLKNVFIGFGWGALILAGAGDTGGEVYRVFLLVSLQIIIGSAVRDVFDIETDRSAGLRTLPVVLGASETLAWLQGANMVCLAAFLVSGPSSAFLLILLPVTAWKALIIEQVRRRGATALWSQTFNILLCFLVFMIIFAETCYRIS